MGNNDKAVYKSKAPYNFIGLENFVLDRCNDEELSTHDKYHEGLKTGNIQYEIEVITPLHISAGRKESFKEKEDSEEENTRKEVIFTNALGQYVIPGNTIRGLTRYNASIFSFASVINDLKQKRDIDNRQFYYRTFASKDINMKKWYSDTLGIKPRQREGFKYTILERVQAGYIRKKGDEYAITPAVKVGNKNAGDEYRMQSYIPIHDLELRKLNIEGIYYLFKDNLKKEDYKKDENRNGQYRPYFKEIRYNVDEGKPKIDINGKFKGMLANSNFINSKRHHYLIFEEDKSSAEIIVSKKLADLYKQDLEYTHKCNAANKEIYEGKEYYALPKEGEVKPVFYVKEGDKLIFGFTPYLRIPSEGDIYGGIPDVHKYYKGTDFVDAVFGWKDFRTKLSFLDAVCESSAPDITKEYEMMLAEPKPSWYKGYLKQRKDTLESYNTEGYEIRGRKFYWMKESLDVKGMEEQDKKEKLVTRMKCYAENTKFIGKIKFENLADEELGLLIYSLKQGDTEGYFNLGKGKPYGFGKCRIRILGLFIEDINKKYASFSADYLKEEILDKYVDTFKKYIVEHYCKKVNSVNEISSYREFELSRKFMKNSECRYMKVSEFAQRAELPTLEDAVCEIGDVISAKMKGTKVKYDNHNAKNDSYKSYGKANKKHNNKGYNNKQSSNQFRSNNKKSTNLNTEAFNIHKDYKCDNIE